MHASNKDETQPVDRGELAEMQSGAPVERGELQDHRRLEILLDIHRAILSTLNLKETAYLALKHVQALAPNCLASSVVLLTPGDKEAQVLAFNFNGSEITWPNEQPLEPMDLAVELDDLHQGKYFLVQDLLELSNLLPLQDAMLANGIRSYLTVPLRMGGELIGLLNLASDIPYRFDPSQIHIIQEVGDVLAVAIQQASLLEIEQHRREEAEIMRDVMAALASSVNLNQVFEVILRNLGKVVRYDRVALYMLNENLQFQLPAGDSLGLKGRQLPNIFPIDDPIVAELRSARRPLVIDDIQQDPRFESWPEREFVRGWMGVPLFAGDEMIGIVSLGDLQPGAYRQVDASLAQMFTGQVADVLYRARRHESSARRAEELELLTAFSFALRQAESRDNVLAALMDQSTQVFGASRGTFLLLEKDESTLVVNFSQDPEIVGQWHAHGDDPLWQVVRSGKAVFVSDIQAAWEQFPYPIYKLLFHGMQSAALLPLNSLDASSSAEDYSSTNPGAVTFGVLCFTFQHHQDFALEDQRIFHAISEIAGTSLRRAVVLEGLEKQVNTRTRHLSTLYEISAIASEPAGLEMLLERMLVLTLEVLEGPMGTIHLLDDHGKTLNLVAKHQIPEEILSGLTNLSLAVPFWRNMLRSSEPVIIPELDIDPRAPQELKAFAYPAFLAAPIRSKGQTLGLISILGETILGYSIEDITLFTTIAEQIGGAVERARLLKQAERAAVTEERQRLARELHDSISQLLYSLVLYAGAARKVLRHGDLQNTAEYLQRIDHTSQQALKEMRLLVYELRPSVFREEGLIGALNHRLQAVEKRTGLNARLVINGEISLDETIELALYRITEEALNNTLKYAEATWVVVSITAQAGAIDLEIKDNGKGFALQAAKETGGLGLMGIQERVSRLGGELEIITAPNEGTTIHVHLEVSE
jgi:signal transduction histidine kinase